MQKQHTSKGRHDQAKNSNGLAKETPNKVRTRKNNTGRHCGEEQVDSKHLLINCGTLIHIRHDGTISVKLKGEVQ